MEILYLFEVIFIYKMRRKYIECTIYVQWGWHIIMSNEGGVYVKWGWGIYVQWGGGGRIYVQWGWRMAYSTTGLFIVTTGADS